MHKIFYSNQTIRGMRAEMKSLVVYYSRTGNTKFVAEEIAAEIGADIEEIVDLKSRAGTMGWLSAGRDATINRQTKIAETKRNPADYDLVVVGSPVWAWSPSAPSELTLASTTSQGRRWRCSSPWTITREARLRIQRS